MTNGLILYFHTGSSSFVNKDIAILSNLGEVKVFAFHSDKKWKTPFLLIKQKLFILQHLFSTKLYVSQFAGYHGYLPGLFARLTGKNFLVVAGGTDCVSFPAIGYGNFNKSLLGLFTKLSFRLATHVSPKHQSLVEYDYHYDKSIPTHQGIKAFVTNYETPITVIANGYDEKSFFCSSDKKPNTFITVTSGLEFTFQQKLKGIDLILTVAAKFPDCQFTIVGVPTTLQLAITSANIKTIPPTKNNELQKLYSEHQFYLQLSMAEGFPNALCEAMLCECVPIVSDVFSMPEIIESSGFVLNERNVELLKELIQTAILTDQQELISKGKLARGIISGRYPISRREKELTQLVFELTS
jgi:glycosyltransferase involved in cell wall biosynthesis